MQFVVFDNGRFTLCIQAGTTACFFKGKKMKGKYTVLINGKS